MNGLISALESRLGIDGLRVQFIDAGDDSTHEVHIAETRFFDNAEFVAGRDEVSYAKFLSKYKYDISELLDITLDDQQRPVVMVRWETGDVTPEPFATIRDDAPAHLDALLKRLEQDPQRASVLEEVRKSLRRARRGRRRT
jgi:hypothetical protein